MDIIKINELWALDSQIDTTDLSNESRKIPELHSKYYAIYSKSNLRLMKLKSELVTLEKYKTEYYNGSMDPLEIKERGWKINSLKILRQDLDKYIQSDDDIVELSLRIGYQNEMSNYLEDILKQIHSRNFILSNIIKWEIFKSGG